MSQGAIAGQGFQVRDMIDLIFGSTKWKSYVVRFVNQLVDLSACLSVCRTITHVIYQKYERVDGAQS